MDYRITNSERGIAQKGSKIFGEYIGELLEQDRIINYLNKIQVNDADNMYEGYKENRKEAKKGYVRIWLFQRGENGLRLADIYANGDDIKILEAIKNYVNSLGIPKILANDIKTSGNWDLEEALRDALIDMLGGTNVSYRSYDNILYEKCLEYVKKDLITFANLLEESNLSILYAEGFFCNTLISEMGDRKEEEEKNINENKMEMLRRKLNQQSNKNSSKTSIYDIDEMTGEEFEIFMYKVFFKMEYSVELTKATGDQGVDLLATSNNGSVVAVQCKRYNQTVSNGAIQEVIAGSKYYNADICLVATNNYFTKSALELAEKSGVILWNRDNLIDIISDMEV